MFPRTLLYEYFPQDIAGLISRTAYIKPQVRFSKDRRMAIDSTGSIWEGIGAGPLEKRHDARRVQAFGLNNTSLITTEGKLVYLDNNKLVNSVIIITDIIPTDRRSYNDFYITPTGKLIISGGSIITLPELLVQAVTNAGTTYLLTVSGRTLVYDIDNLTVSTIDNNTDTVKLTTTNDVGCLQLKVDGTIWSLTEDGISTRKDYPIPKELGRVVDIVGHASVLAVLGVTGLLAKIIITSDSTPVVEPNVIFPLAFDLTATTIVVVTEEGNIIHRNFWKSDGYTTASRVRLT